MSDTAPSVSQSVTGSQTGLAQASDEATYEAAGILNAWGMEHANIPAARAVLNAFIASHLPAPVIEVIGLQWEEEQRRYPMDGPEVVKIWGSRAINQRWGTIIECTDGYFTLLDSPEIGRYPTFEKASEIAQSNFAGKIAAASRLTLSSPTHWHNGAGQVMDIQSKGAQDEKVRLRFSEALYSVAPYSMPSSADVDVTETLKSDRAFFAADTDLDAIRLKVTALIRAHGPTEALAQRLAAALPPGRRPVGHQTAYSALLAFIGDPEIIKDDMIQLFDRAISYGKPEATGAA